MVAGVFAGLVVDVVLDGDDDALAVGLVSDLLRAPHLQQFGGVCVVGRLLLHRALNVLEQGAQHRQGPGDEGEVTLYYCPENDVVNALCIGIRWSVDAGFDEDEATEKEDLPQDHTQSNQVVTGVDIHYTHRFSSLQVPIQTILDVGLGAQVLGFPSCLVLLMRLSQGCHCVLSRKPQTIVFKTCCYRRCVFVKLGV